MMSVISGHESVKHVKLFYYVKKKQNSKLEFDISRPFVGKLAACKSLHPKLRIPCYCFR